MLDKLPENISYENMSQMPISPNYMISIQQNQFIHYKKQFQFIQSMSIHRHLYIDQNSQHILKLAQKNATTKSTCGYLTLALCQFLTEQPQFNVHILKDINELSLTPYIEKVMKRIAQTRRLELKKFINQMNESQRKSYMTDWVANYQIPDYLESISDKMLNKQIYFFRQVSYDHPKAMELLKYQQKQRVKQQQIFKGQHYFYTSFNPLKHHYKQEFIDALKFQTTNYQLPIIIATDVLGHYNTTILFKGQIYILDTLTSTQYHYQNGIDETIAYYYKNSFLKE